MKIVEAVEMLVKNEYEMANDAIVRDLESFWLIVTRLACSAVSDACGSGELGEVACSCVRTTC